MWKYNNDKIHESIYDLDLNFLDSPKKYSVGYGGTTFLHVTDSWSWVATASSWNGVYS